MLNKLFFLIVLIMMTIVPLAIGQRSRAGEPNIAIGPRVETSGCPGEAAITLPLPTVQPSDFVRLRRTRCFGTCPDYTVQIGADGQISWRGENYVRAIGAETATINPRDARGLIEKLQTAGFWKLCSSYSATVSDASTVITTLHIADREKQVSDYFNTAPSWLQDLEREIDVLADTHRWIHGDPRRETVALVRLRNTRVDFSAGRVGRSLDADARGPKPGLTPLMQASARGNLSEIQKQLSAKADPNAQDSSGWTALMYATLASDPQAMKILLDSGADANGRSYMGQTALMAVSAAYSSAPEKFRLLAAARADVNAQDTDGHTALMFAMYGSLGSSDRGFLERAELVSLLREAGARTDLVDGAGLTVFDYLDEEAAGYPYGKSESDKLRQILQNPTPGTFPPVKVSGRVVISPGTRLWASTIELERVGVGIAVVQVPVMQDGSFEFPRVVPGPYTVRLAPQPSFPLPSMSLVIPNKEVTGLEITVPAVKEIGVRVAVEGDAPTPGFGLILVAVSGGAARSGPPPRIPADLASIVPLNIQAALAGGAASLQLVRLGTSPLVDDATFRIALPSPWTFGNVSLSNPLPDASFRITLPDGDYHVAAILPRLRGGLPRIYNVKSLTSGSSDLLSDPLRISGADPAEIRVTFVTTPPSTWRKLSGRVVGLAAGAESTARVVLLGEVMANIDAPVNPDGSFEFPRVLPGRYIARFVAGSGEINAAAQRRLGVSDNIITVTDKDLSGIEISVPR